MTSATCSFSLSVKAIVTTEGTHPPWDSHCTHTHKQDHVKSSEASPFLCCEGLTEPLQLRAARFSLITLLWTEHTMANEYGT